MPNVTFNIEHHPGREQERELLTSTLELLAPDLLYVLSQSSVDWMVSLARACGFQSVTIEHRNDAQPVRTLHGIVGYMPGSNRVEVHIS